jgi:hypothetical protein
MKKRTQISQRQILKVEIKPIATAMLVKAVFSDTAVPTTSIYNATNSMTHF